MFFKNSEMKDFTKEFDYYLEKRRRETFKSWVFEDSAKCSASKLAEAGFIFIGNKHEPDSVKCFLCDKHLDCWDEDDDPWAEHLKHSPHCTFAKLEKSERELTVTEFIDIKNEFIETLSKRFIKKRREKFDRLFTEYVERIRCLK